jgi:hypothetical protein
MSVSPSPSSSPRRNYFSSSISPEIRKIKSILNKTTNDTYSGLIKDLLQVNVLEELDNTQLVEDEARKNIDYQHMLPVVQIFIANICFGKEDADTIRIYTQIFCELRKKWYGRQGKVLLRVMISEIDKFFKTYLTTEVDDSDRKKCFCVIRFFCNLYNEKIIPSQMVLVVNNSFCGDEEIKVEAFHRFITYTSPEIRKEAIYSRFKAQFEDLMRRSIKRTDFSIKKLNFDSEITLKKMTA